MPGVLLDDKLDPFAQAYSLPPPSPFFCGSPLSVPFQQPLPAQSPFQNYIPVLTRVIPAGSYDEELSRALSQLSPLSYHRAGLGNSVDVNPTSELLKCQGDDVGLSEPPPAPRISRWANAGSLTLAEASLAALQKFLPSNFENGAGEEEDSAAEWAMLDIYSSDEFRMYEFKVRRCMRGRSHDWTECPFAHPGEKARRRDPRRLHYSGTPCADFRKGGCKKGDACEFAHGVFECWLHPARYRTQPCKDGRCCRRRVCFFAHTAEQLRLLSPVSPSSPPSSSSSRLPAMEAPLEPSVTSAASPSSSSSQLFTVMEAPAEAFPVSGPSLYSSSLRFSPIEAPPEAFPASGSSLSCSPLRNSAMEPPAEAFTTHATSLQNEACFNRILSASLSSNRAHGFSSSPKSSFSTISPVSLSPPLSPSQSPPESPINWSPRALSYAFPLQQSAHVYPSYHGQPLHAGHSQASLPSVPAHRRHLEKLNSSLSLAIPPTHDLSLSALSSPTSSQSLQHIEDLVYLLKQADLTQQEPLWLHARATQASMAQKSKFSSCPSPLRRASQSVPATPTKMGFRNEDPNLCCFDDDREASEPKLERVESGRGLRAQIFESLIKSQQQSCSTDPESNPSPVSL